MIRRLVKETGLSLKQLWTLFLMDRRILRANGREPPSLRDVSNPYSKAERTAERGKGRAAQGRMVGVSLRASCAPCCMIDDGPAVPGRPGWHSWRPDREITRRWRYG